MSELNDIDKLLKESFSEFTPDAPNVWQGIEQGVQSAQAAQGAGVAGAVKGAGIVAKMIAAVAVSASLVAGYVMLSDKKEEAPAMTATTHEVAAPTQPAIIAEEEPVGENTRNTTSRQEVQRTTAVPAATTASHTHVEPEQTKAAVMHNPKAESTGGDAGIRTEEKPSTPQVIPKTTPNEPAAKPVTPATAENTARRQENVTKQDQANPVPKPYNPNAEEDEEFEKPTIPGSFSPDGDGVNDRFVILIDQEASYALTIVDKNQRVVFESDNKMSTWDGRDMRTGMICSQGTYYYTFRYQFKGSQVQRKKNGIIGLF